MGLVEQYENQIKPRLNYSQELSELSPIKKGDYWALVCPQCEKKEAFIYENTGIIGCSRKDKCGYKKDFLAYKNGGEYPRGQAYIDLIKELGDKYGVPIDEELGQQYLKNYERKESDQEILSKLWAYFTSLLPNSNGGKYLESREFPLNPNFFGMYPTIQELKKWVGTQKIDISRCEKLGLFRLDFQNKLIGVWRTQNGEICNFWVRSLDGKEPKYSRLKSHSHLEQDYPQGSETIKGESIIWVEGHLDVIAADLSGLKGVVGGFGDKVPFASLGKLNPKIITLCLDRDSAGEKGTFEFIQKNLKSDIQIYVAKIPYEDCKDISDVYTVYGGEKVKEVFNQSKLINGLGFCATYILNKHRGDDWISYNKGMAVKELKDFADKVPSLKQWELKEFWEEASEELEIEKKDICTIANNIEEKKKKEAIQENCKIQLEKAKEAFNKGELDQGNKVLQDLHASNQTEAVSISALQNALKPSSEQEVINEIERTSDTINTGYHFTEDVPIGFKGGAISVVAAPTGHGKTMALINFALGVLSNNPDKSIYFFTYEESKSAITTRFLNTYIGETLSTNNRKTIEHYYKNPNENENRFKFFSNKNKTKPLFLSKKKEFYEQLIESGRLNIVYADYNTSNLFSLIRGIREKKDNLGLICIDYFQLLNANSVEKKASRQEELKAICLQMKNCAIDTGLPILVAAQFNREVGKKADMHPTRIGEAGDIERVANLIIGLWNLRKKPINNKVSQKGTNNHNDKQWKSIDALYFEVLKGREIGSGHSITLVNDGNTGKIFTTRHRTTESQETNINDTLSTKELLGL